MPSAVRWHSEKAASSPTAKTANEDAGRDLLVEQGQTNGVLTLTLNRARQRNALSRSLLELLHTELEEAAKAPHDIRAIILQAEGNVFSSGHDLKELRNATQSEQKDVFELCSEVMQLLPSIPQPTIGAVDGLAIAAGCQLVASCDLVVGNPMSGYATPGAKTIGLFCHTPGVPLVRCIGLKKALDMLYTGRTITAFEALQYGLITHVAANPRREALKIAGQIASQSASAMQSGKHILYQQAERSTLEEAYEVASQAMLDNMQTNDAQEGIDAFIEKRDGVPEWKHK